MEIKTTTQIHDESKNDRNFKESKWIKLDDIFKALRNSYEHKHLDEQSYIFLCKELSQSNTKGDKRINDDKSIIYCPYCNKIIYNGETIIWINDGQEIAHSGCNPKSQSNNGDYYVNIQEDLD